MRITIKDLQKTARINPAQIKEIACKISPPPRLSNLKLSLYFVNNSLIKKLNKQFFGKNCLTDVISFGLSKECAEVFIAPSVVRKNSKIFGVEFKEEFYRCVIHGILHVFGFRDEVKKEKERMWKKQESLLKGIIS